MSQSPVFHIEIPGAAGAQASAQPNNSAQANYWYYSKCGIRLSSLITPARHVKYCGKT